MLNSTLAANATSVENLYIDEYFILMNYIDINSIFVIISSIFSCKNIYVLIHYYLIKDYH